MDQSYEAFTMNRHTTQTSFMRDKIPQYQHVYRNQQNLQFEDFLGQEVQKQKKLVQQDDLLASYNLTLGNSEESEDQDEKENLVLKPKINNQSELSFRKQVFIKNNVFNRLYDDAKRKKTQLVSKDLSVNISQISTQNLLSRSTSQVKVRGDQRQQRSSNKKSKLTQFDESILEPVENRLIRFAEEKNKRNEILRQEILKKDLSMLSFRPSLNKKSVQLCKKHQISNEISPMHTKIRSDINKTQRKSYQQKRNLINKRQFQCSFQPSINRNSIETVRERGLSFIQRQEQFVQMKENNQNLIASQMCEKKNSFSPLFQRGRQQSNSYHKNEIWDRLYQDAGRRKRSISNQINEQIKNQQKQKYSPLNLSERRVYDQSLLLIKNIFDDLDSDKDGFIDSHHIDLKNINYKYLELVAPILYEMDDNQEKLNLGVFIQKILKNVSYDQIQQQDQHTLHKLLQTKYLIRDSENQT